MDEDLFTWTDIYGKWGPVTQKLTQAFVDAQVADGPFTR